MDWKRIILTLGQIAAVTVISVLFSKTTISRLTSIPAMTNSMSGVDFKMSDVYNSVVSRMSTTKKSENVVIVSVDDCSREEIAEVINLLDSCEPAAVGLDIIYQKKKKHDKVLIDAIRSCDNLVLPRRILGYGNSRDLTDADTAYFYDNSFAHYGVVNLEAEDLDCPVRRFRPVYTLPDSQKVFSMAGELVRIARPEVFDSLMVKVQRDGDSLVINYPNITFTTLSGAELLSKRDSINRNFRGAALQEANDSLASPFKGKIVLVGKLYDGHDLHLTPIDITMPGVKIQAYTVETILGKRFLREASEKENWRIAIIVCIIFLTLNFISVNHFPNVGKILLRLLQILCLFQCYIIGSIIYYYNGVYVDFIPTFTMIALGFFSYDIWIGAVGVVRAASRRIKGRKERREKRRAKRLTKKLRARHRKEERERKSVERKLKKSKCD